MPEHICPSSQLKSDWRRRFLLGRSSQNIAARAVEGDELTAHFRDALLPTLPAGATICAYIPVGTEPGSLAMLDAAVAAGARVLAPVTGPPGPLEWARYAGADRLRPGRHGLREPDGEVLPPSAIADAALILIPALGADLSGVRLGRGAGHYDRSLPLAAADARLVVVVRDAELVAELPHDPHDVPMHYALTPDQGLVRLLAP